MGVSENLKRGVTEIVLLALLSQQDMYGYEMAQAMRERTLAQRFSRKCNSHFLVVEKTPPVAYGDRLPFLSLRDIFPRPGEVVLWDGAFGIAVNYPTKAQSFRVRQRLPPRGSWQSR